MSFDMGLPLVMIRNGWVYIATPNGPHADYTFSLDRCDTPLKLLWWIEHLTSKMWVDREIINELVVVVSARFDWQEDGANR